MAYYFSEPFAHVQRIPVSYPVIRPRNVFQRTSASTPDRQVQKGQASSLYANIPMVSAIMQAVSDDRMAIALAQEGGISFLRLADHRERGRDGVPRQS